MPRGKVTNTTFKDICDQRNCFFLKSPFNFHDVVSSRLIISQLHIGHQPRTIQNAIITINALLVLKMRDIIFFLRANYVMGHFKGYFEGAKTRGGQDKRDNLGVKKVLAPSKYPLKWPIM